MDKIGLDSSKGVAAEVSPSLVAATAQGGKGSRIFALDFTKGALVLVMILYHWLNYFVGPQGSFYRYLSFLPPSFICITGFLIAQVYLSKSRVGVPKLPRRVFVRGIKLLIIFIVLNVGISLLLSARYTGRSLFETYSAGRLESIFLTGNMIGGRAVAFYVLLPISYLLLLSAVLLLVHRHLKGIFHVMTVVCLMAILVLFLNDSQSESLELVAIGFLGISIGQISLARINRFLSRPSVIIVAYLLYAAAITVWNVPYPLQVAGVLLTLLLIYWLGSAAGETGRVQCWLIMLGKYSLLGYIAQIAILQILRRGCGSESAALASVTALLAGILLTFLTVGGVDRARSKSAIVNRLYAAVFM